MKYLLLFALSVSISLPSYSQNPSSLRETGEMLVQFKPTLEAVNALQFANDFVEADISFDRQLSERMNIWLLTFDESRASANQLLEKVRSHPMVSLAQFNHLVTEREVIPNDPSFDLLWAMQNTGQMNGTPSADIKATFAWDITTSGTTVLGDTIVVAMVDGGIDLNHNDLKLWKNRLEIPGNGIDDDLNGYIDDYNGWNAYGNNGNVQSSDHGTHVAGTATAIGNNENGVTGVAFNTYLMPISGSGSNEALVVASYDYIFTMRRIYNETNGSAGAFVVATNSSFGIDMGNPVNYPLWGAIYDSLGSVGILNVASTANRNWNIDEVGDIPTGMTNNSVVAITNSTNTDALNSQAGYGLVSIDLAAPGTNIYSSRPGNTYGYKTGTSMSSPHVTGSIALMYAAADSVTIEEYRSNPELVSLKFKQYLIASVDTLPAFVGRTVSGGRLNLFNTLLMVQNPPSISVEPDSVSVLLGPGNIANIALEIASTGSGYNPFSVLIPDTISWVSSEFPNDTLSGSLPKQINLSFAAGDLDAGNYTTEITIRDYFLNEITIPVSLDIELGVDSKILSGIDAGFRVFPNPFTSGFKIFLSLPESNGAAFQLFRSNGAKVYETSNQAFSAGSYTFNVNETLAPGVYFLRLTTNNFVRTLKLIAQ
ncbi:MAG: S8 family peptidase [Lentimicrobium sp.]|nr:S8 family peptidase [Lentimicrobium sp.]